MKIDFTNKVAVVVGSSKGIGLGVADKFEELGAKVIRVSRTEGIDISDKNLANAGIWCQTNHVPIPTLIKSNGIDLSLIPSDTYDVVFSTICLQHICVHDIRFNLMQEFYRVLKPGGSICLQMGFGNNHPKTVGYFENNYEATVTNSGCDTRIDSPDEPKSDLEKIRFHSFDYDIRPVGPGDHHANWIYFRATK